MVALVVLTAADSLEAEAIVSGIKDVTAVGQAVVNLASTKSEEISDPEHAFLVNAVVTISGATSADAAV